MFVQAQQAILAATQFVIELNAAVQANADMAHIYDRMRDLELFLDPLSTAADSWVLPSTASSAVDFGEEVVSRSLRCMARIKLNRWVFLDDESRFETITEHYEQCSDQSPSILCLFRPPSLLRQAL